MVPLLNSSLSHSRHCHPVRMRRIRRQSEYRADPIEPLPTEPSVDVPEVTSGAFASVQLSAECFGVNCLIFPW